MRVIYETKTCLMLAVVCLSLGAQTKEPIPTVKNADKDVRVYVQVDPATKIIEEKSVNPLAGLRAKQSVGLTQGAGLVDMQEEMPNGATYYVFKLKPKENLKLNLKCEMESMVWMQFVKPAVSDRMSAAYRRANMAPKNLRSKKIEITNIMDVPYEIVLALYGTVNYGYSLQIERKE